MSGKFDRWKWKLMNAMSGRRGPDALGNASMGAAIVLFVVAFLAGSRPLSWLAIALMCYAIFRVYSKNVTARERENRKFLEITAKPRRAGRIANKKWENRKTTLYFKCKGCGQELSVPRGKGTLCVVCPKCKTETKIKS